ncbi:2-dehydro-3-deoxygalactonokinase [Neobacillus sp. PS2-9]|uniref:2-dehydro-3-deoxygalactonokinase n=1 Tax=Neobacillus sp. PS2-9 TaxID=3070676 RepID=UPI0027DFCD14|nr:2-dehydro-3-deoxygalactonokinase [Neobacillus sp. PS2-9]WML56641.1 2-dehydro-3-deoxygalactonokinase [Neobacillus sp. PS2-9]
MYTITIDTGTTNTRITLWKNDIAHYKTSKEVGVRDTAVDGNNSRLKASIKEGIDEVLSANMLRLGDVTKILASGMITSNVGVFEVPHLTAPVGMQEVADGMISQYLPDIVEKEIWFVPGVKNNVSEITMENCEAMDMMRGEEVETIALIRRLNLSGPSVIVLPGSHSKYVAIDENNKITGCLTSLAGEILSVITNHTIIANALEKSFADELEKDMIIQGYKNSQQYGLSRLTFTVRIMDQFTDLTVNQKANFLLGVVLSDELKAVKNSKALAFNKNSNVVIAGKDILKQAYEVIFNEDKYFSQVTSVDSKDLEDLAGYGSICLSEMRGFS